MELLWEYGNKVVWEVHGKIRIGRAKGSTYRIEHKPNSEDYILFEVVGSDTPIAITGGTLEFCKGVVEGFEIAMMGWATVYVAGRALVRRRPC